MAKCRRHFFALMRKNTILWYRTPCCAIFEILVPILLMIGLVELRIKLPKVSTDNSGMLKKKVPKFPRYGR